MEKIYWEEQVASLCGVHCINNLLQGAYFSEGDFAEIAHALDEQERKLMASMGTETPDFLAHMAKDSSHVDEAGNFSIEVIKKALETNSLSGVSLDSDTVKEGKVDLLKENGYVCNLGNHWIAIRKLYGKWYNLNSTLKFGPHFISDFYLSAYLKQLNLDGYAIFVVRGTFPTKKTTYTGRGKWLWPDEIMEITKKHQSQKQKKKPPPPQSPPMRGESDFDKAMRASLKEANDRAIQQSKQVEETKKKRTK